MSETALSLGTKWPRGEMFGAGKTKELFAVDGHEDKAILEETDYITAGDGLRRDVLPGKGALTARTTSNVFRLLRECRIPVAFIEQDSETSFVAWRCKMLPYEVVVRREAHGSYCKRNPHVRKGHLFPKLIVEFFLKTSGKRWKEHQLPCDDPFMVYDETTSPARIKLFDPAKPIHGAEPFLVLDASEVFAAADEAKHFPEMDRIARQTFLVLEKAWQLLGRTLVDFKVEFGLAPAGMLLLADEITNDSWRVLEGADHIDKQIYRDGGSLDDVLLKYRLVAELTGRFHVPRQRVVLWRGSESDDTDVFLRACEAYGMLMPNNFDTFTMTCSAHKEPERAVEDLRKLIHDVPDSVVIAYVGMSNAAGPLLSANAMAPVITVPATFGKFKGDVWSSLRMPSNVPVSTILNPANAFLAALRILAMRNPFFYALLQAEIEGRAMNTVPI